MLQLRRRSACCSSCLQLLLLCICGGPRCTWPLGALMPVHPPISVGTPLGAGAGASLLKSTPVDQGHVCYSNSRRQLLAPLGTRRKLQHSVGALIYSACMLHVCCVCCTPLHVTCVQHVHTCPALPTLHTAGREHTKPTHDNQKRWLYPPPTHDITSCLLQSMTQETTPVDNSYTCAVYPGCPACTRSGLLHAVQDMCSAAKPRMVGNNAAAAPATQRLLKCRAGAAVSVQMQKAAAKYN